MKDYPILFSAPMVRAILDGSKTQTRRVCKPAQKSFLTRVINCLKGLWGDEEGDVQFKCPYGQPGDRLWVRETWSIEALGAFGTPKGYDSTYEVRFKAGGDEREIHVAPGEPDPYIKIYDSQRGDWRPSIHMPRWASRIQLEIVSVRVERLKECSREDAAAEGVCYLARERWDERRKVPGGEAVIQPSMWPEQNFGRLWEHINGAGSWDANPWVWVVEFKRVTA